ncbi:MAG TPA: universal stress protein [Gammaproteobacteria bacterium]|nr:universal stress protein [Gammaproteobacteria bacterium]
MTAIRRILAVLDPTSKRQPALERAAWLARRSHAALELFICGYDPGFVAGEHFDPPALEKLRRAAVDGYREALHERARDLAESGLGVEVDVRFDHPLHEGVVRKAADSRADVVFKDTHYHPALRRSIFSNTDWELIRSCPAPLWLVKAGELPPRPHVLAAIDPLHEHDKPAALDSAILSAATELRDVAGGELDAFHAFDMTKMIAASPDATPMPLGDLADMLRRDHTEAVLALTDEFGLAREKVHVEEGETRERLIALTERLGTDVVVIGAVSRRGLRRWFLGSTAEQVLDWLPCDLLIIKPPADAEPG